MNRITLAAVALGLVSFFALAGSAHPPDRAGAQEPCDPAYPGVCIRASEGDYDCEGAGDGPNFLVGPIEVRPPDPHGLDTDGDGTGCESGEAAPVEGETAPQPAAPVAAQTAPNPTSEVAGSSQDPAAPAAGFGPDRPDEGGSWSWMIAGLAGAGIAWLIAGMAGAGVRLAQTRGSAPPRVPHIGAPVEVSDPGAREAVTAETGRLNLRPLPPLLQPPAFRRRLP